MVEQFHERHCEMMLTADIPPRAKLRRSMTHTSLLGQIHTANADTAAGRLLLTRLLEDVKRLQFDGLHTLKFVFNSARVARRYTGLGLRLNGTCIELEDTTEDAAKATYRPARLRRLDAVRAYGVDALGLVALLAALGRLEGVDVIDAERSRAESSDIVDNGFFQLRFSTEHCPIMLRGVTKLEMHGHAVTLHHHVIYQRLPCARCYAPYHTTGFCKAKPGQLAKTQAKFRRTYKGPVPEYDVGTATQYMHTDGDSLDIFLATLHRDLTGAAEPCQGDTPPLSTAELVTESRLLERPQRVSPEVNAMVPEAVVTGGTEAVTANPPGEDATAATCTSSPVHPNLSAPSLAHGKASSATMTPVAGPTSRNAAAVDSTSVKNARSSGGGGKSKLKPGKPKEGRTKGTTYLTPRTAKGKTSA
ncbi:hypothetical protein PR003_g22658 [Phytophthora rubi]|uniref:Uncharacterized protein n=1 Tax=Phytophthora rubi TaxID=129364 RepID=A0A6A4D3Q8_9STRA|nr:hypothetical protein PR002_g22005 [Phytophthora rubi]KAE8990400.1 hypothetical protein PR001_g21493 [Phytophthora rubi]KAE9300859.1 hypothetical protein PR003_g22658 [Phytophthora rubi]